MNIALVGLNHKTAPLGVREKVNFSDNSLEGSYRFLKAYPEISESFILSTCNRVELYGVGRHDQEIAGALKDFLCKTHEMKRGVLDKYLYLKNGVDAEKHLLRVAAGLDSMVIGENQILGQIKQAYSRAEDCGSIDSGMHSLLQRALCVGKKVRSLTGISRGVTSLPGAALELIKRERDLTSERALIIGAGKIGAMALARLVSCGIKEVVVINRDRSKAEALKKWTNVTARGLDAFRDELVKADIVIAATASIEYLITKDMVEEALRTRSRSMLLVDMGVPRNIEESAGRCKGARLYNIDDLGLLIKETKRNRACEAEKAEEIIREEICEKLYSV